MTFADEVLHHAAQHQTRTRPTRREFAATVRELRACRDAQTAALLRRWRRRVMRPSLRATTGHNRVAARRLARALGAAA